MQFSVTGTLILSLYKKFEADSLQDALEQVDSWETWGQESLLDIMEVSDSSCDLDTITKLKRRKAKTK